jgi:hypothetical protein
MFADLLAPGSLICEVAKITALLRYRHVPKTAGLMTRISIMTILTYAVFGGTRHYMGHLGISGFIAKMMRSYASDIRLKLVRNPLTKICLHFFRHDSRQEVSMLQLWQDYNESLKWIHELTVPTIRQGKKLTDKHLQSVVRPSNVYIVGGEIRKTP